MERVEFYFSCNCAGPSNTLLRLNQACIPSDMALQSYGRFPLQPGEPVRIWDMSGGMGTFLYGCLEAGMTVSSYSSIEINPETRGVLKANFKWFSDSYPSQLPSPHLWMPYFDSRLPQNLLDWGSDADTYERLRSMPDEHLPDIISITTPCTEGSAAGMGKGMTTPKGFLALHAIRITRCVIVELNRRRTIAGLPLDFAPLGWIFETSPIKSARNSNLSHLDDTLALCLGQKAIDNDGAKGATAIRWTQMYTNMGRSSDWPSISSRSRRLPMIPLRSILRSNEIVQTWNSDRHGPASWPNIEGHPIRAYPKFVRSLGSYQHRVGTAGSCRSHSADDPRGDAPGVTRIGGIPHLPTPSMMELAVGLREGYTEESMRSLGSATRPRSLARTEVTVASRMGMIGDMWGRRLITETMKDRAESSIAMTDAVPAPPPPPPSAKGGPSSVTSTSTSRSVESSASKGGYEAPHGLSPGARQPHCHTPAPPSEEDALPPSEEVVSEAEVQTAMPAGSLLGRGVDEELDALGEDFVSYKSFPPPGLKSDRVKPPPSKVPDRLPPGSPEDTKPGGSWDLFSGSLSSKGGACYAARRCWVTQSSRNMS